MPFRWAGCFLFADCCQRARLPLCRHQALLLQRGLRQLLTAHTPLPGGVPTEFHIRHPYAVAQLSGIILHTDRYSHIARPYCYQEEL